MYIDPSLSLSSIEDFLPANLKKHHQNQTSEGIHVFSPKVLNSLITALEKDAISLALRVSGFADDDISSWCQESESTPFFQGYEDVVIREDPVVIYDSQVFGDWNQIGKYVVGAAEFMKEGHKLTIMNVNRHKIEETHWGLT